jgi:hypothetical protein
MKKTMANKSAREQETEPGTLEWFLGPSDPVEKERLRMEREAYERELKNQRRWARDVARRSTSSLLDF